MWLKKGSNHSFISIDTANYNLKGLIVKRSAFYNFFWRTSLKFVLPIEMLDALK